MSHLISQLNYLVVVVLPLVVLSLSRQMLYCACGECVARWWWRCCFEADRVGLYCLFWILYWVCGQPMDHNTNVKMPNLYNHHLSLNLENISYFWLLIVHFTYFSVLFSQFQVLSCACYFVMLAPRFSRFSVDALHKEDLCWFLPNSWPKAAQGWDGSLTI